MSIIKYFLYLVVSFVITFCITVLIYFEDIKGDLVKDFDEKNSNVEVYLKELLTHATIDNNFAKIDAAIKTFITVEFFKDINIEYKRFVFSKKAILLNSNKVNNDKFTLSDVTTDYKFGKIVALDETTYEFIPNVLFDTKTPVLIKFQAYNIGDVYNSTSTLNFYKTVKAKQTENKNNSLSWLYNLISFDEIEVNKSFSIVYEKNPFVAIEYTLNKSPLIEQTVIFIKKIFIYSFSLFLITIVILYIFYKQVIKKDIERPINKIGEYVNDILDNKYVRLEKVNTQLMHIDTIFSKLQFLSKKVASLTNETNINKSLLERKDFIDEVTGLDNKKVFEKDIKTMFVTNKTGYIVLTKINKLGEFASKNGSNDANVLIKDFGHTIVSLLKKYSKINSKVFRFYGAEFALIIDVNNLEKVQEILEYVSSKLEQHIKSNYLLEGDVVYFGATPFDNYGTVDSILRSAHDSFMECVNGNKKLFSISDNAALIEKTRQHEVLVADIIKREDFTIKFVYDTFEMDDETKMIMQDASPIIINSETFEMFPIGIFISVAEKTNLSSAFDRILIEKVLDYLKYEKVKHKIAINLSMKSLTDKKFLSWLEGILLYSDDAKNNLVFSVTSYNAKENLEKFKNLIEVIHKFDSEVLLKRFSLDDFSLDDLATLEIDYIRLNKDYCIDINNNRERKHAVKNIILYGEMNDVFILGDMIKSDEDYKTMSRLGLYATSR